MASGGRVGQGEGGGWGFQASVTDQMWDDFSGGRVGRGCVRSEREGGGVVRNAASWRNAGGPELPAGKCSISAPPPEADGHYHADTSARAPDLII